MSMLGYVKNIAGLKREFRSQQARIQRLPEGYRFVMEKIQQYIWGFASGDGADMLRVQAGVIELLEAGAAQGKHVLDVTGRDVAGFCDELLRSARLWTDNYRERLNRDILRRLGEEAPQ